jgi:hypothetical protein
MYLIQLLLPVYDNDGAAFPHQRFAEVRKQLTERFGGLTAYARAPAVGLWADGEGERPKRDDIVVHEVMAESLDREWWANYRASLQARFEQDEIVVRAQAMERL